MKKIIFLAMLSLAFASGCQNFTKCDDAKNEGDCIPSNFKDIKCKWDGKACVSASEPKPETPETPYGPY